MVTFDSRSHDYPIDLLAYLVNEVPQLENLLSTDLILLISGVVFGTLQPNVKLGPAITDFLTERIHILYTDMI